MGGTTGPVWAAREYIRLTDIARIYNRCGWPLSPAMLEHISKARARLDEALPSRRTWRSWPARRPWHTLTVSPTMKMDTPRGLFRAVCSCGYESGVDSEKGAFTSGTQHVKAKTTRT